MLTRMLSAAFVGQRFGEIDARRPRHAGGDRPRRRLFARDSGHIDDPSTSLLAHMRNGEPRAADGAKQLYLDILLPDLVNGLFKRHGRRTAGVVDQDVEASEALDRLQHELRAIGRIVTSARTASTSPPVAEVISLAVVCSTSSRRAQIATRTPSSQRRNAVARPIPSLPPVIAATLPCNPRSMRPFRLLIVLTLLCLSGRERYAN